MIGSHPPYALAPTTFRFPALAALAGRMPIGGPREVVLATYLAARLAHDALPERGVPGTVRAERVAGARTWLSSLTLPAPIRPTLIRVVEASGAGPLPIAEAVRAVLSATSSLLDTRSRSELDQLATALERS